MSEFEAHRQGQLDKAVDAIWLDAKARESKEIYFIADSRVPTGYTEEEFEKALQERASQHGAILTPMKDGWQIDFQQAA